MRRLVPVFLLLVTVIFAEEKSAPAEKPAAPADDAIASAKRDFDAVKSTNRSSVEGLPGLPAANAPEASAPMSAPQPMPARMGTVPENKPANWLVDAMMKKSGKDGEKPADEKLPDAKSAGKLDLLAQVRDATPAKSAAIPENEKLAKTSGPEFNPLTPFMAAWMTPQDFTLLKPTGGSAAAPEAIAHSAAPAANPSVESNLSMVDKGGGADGLGFSHAASPPAAPMENPFLQTVASPPPGAFSLSLPPSSVITPTGVSATPTTMNAFTPPPDLAPPKSNLPDFVKPADDEKYFKQLKRF